MVRCTTLMLSALLLTATPRSARAVKLSQEQAVKRAVKRHPLIQAGHHGTRASQARASMAKTGWLPRVQLQGGYMLMGPVQKMSLQIDPGIPGIDPITMERDLGNLHNASVGLTVAWRAWDFGARDVRTSAAKALVEASRAETKERAAKIAYAARAAYLAALFFEELAQVTRRSLKLSLAERSEHLLKKKEGVGNDLSVARAEIRVAELRARLSKAEQERQRALDNLRILLGLKKGATLELTDNLKTLGSRPVKGKIDKRVHPSRLRLRSLERASKLEVKRLGRSWWPTLDVVGQVKYQFPKNYFETEQAGIFASVGVMLTWNIFDGDLTRRQRHQARAKVSQVKALTRAADEDIARKLTDSRSKIRIAKSSVASAQRILKAARVYLKAARASLKAGTGTGLELRKAEEALDQARLGELKAYFDGALARASYLLAQGKGAK